MNLQGDHENPYNSSSVIGVDFDNTVINYDDVIRQTAIDRALISTDGPKGKNAIREHIRHLRKGELHWRKLQAIVYGTGIKQATLFSGVGEFLIECQRLGARAYIVSHKTQFSDYDNNRIDLRIAALRWMDANGFFDSNRIGLSHDDVFFEATRQDKINRIKLLGCTHFVDDLKEVFLESSFPSTVRKILYSPGGRIVAQAGTKSATTWTEISEYILGKSR